eukprot:1327219-Amorphochlora_amoeboformis.AAC.1
MSEQWCDTAPGHIFCILHSFVITRSVTLCHHPKPIRCLQAAREGGNSGKEGGRGPGGEGGGEAREGYGWGVGVVFGG